MSAIEEYRDRGPVEVSTSFSTEALVGKSAVITGGASGLGKAYTQAFADAGAYVTIGDIDEVSGNETAKSLEGKVQFIKCDVRNWNDQVSLFEAASKFSPHSSCDLVIANAGIVGEDDVFKLEDPDLPPVKPDLSILNVDLIGMIYTTKLAFHYFRRQPIDKSRDRCLILKASIAAYVDQPGTPQYNVAKWGARALMRNLRRTAWEESIRVNLVAPWYVRTPSMPESIQEHLDGQGVGLATVKVSCKALLKIATDTSINGRALGVVPRKYAPDGYLDLDSDDYQDGDIFKEMQEVVIETMETLGYVKPPETNGNANGH